MNKSLCATLVKICTSEGGPLFHSLYDGVIARKMLPTQSIFHRPEQMKVRRHQIRTIRWVWYNSPTKIDNVFHGLQTGMGPGVIMLQEKSCLLLWPDSGTLSLQLSHDVAVRVDGLKFKIYVKSFSYLKSKKNSNCDSVKTGHKQTTFRSHPTSRCVTGSAVLVSKKHTAFIFNSLFELLENVDKATAYLQNIMIH